MSEDEPVRGRTRPTSVNRSLSRAWTAPVRAMNRILGAADGRTGKAGHGRIDGSAVVDCGLYIGGRREPGFFSPDEALHAARERENGFVWLGLHQPSQPEMAAVARTYGLHELAVED